MFLLRLLLKLVQLVLKRIKGKPFSGVWATFEYLDDTCDAATELKKKGYHDIISHSPCFRPELLQALGKTQSPLPVITLLFGIAGAVLATLMVVWMSLDWVLPVSGKPIISINPMIIIIFELIILFGAYGTALGMLLLGLRERAKTKLPKSDQYRSYQRFTQDRFGLVVNCDPSAAKAVSEILSRFSAEEVTCEA